MARTPDEKLLSERHRMMLEYQKKIAPFIPRTQELMVLFGYASTSSAGYIIRELYKRGKAIRRKIGGRGQKYEYYAVE